jgi:hypothetical protein
VAGSRLAGEVTERAGLGARDDDLPAAPDLVGHEVAGNPRNAGVGGLGDMKDAQRHVAGSLH